MIICYILITKQCILCGECRENLHTDKLVECERATSTGSVFPAHSPTNIPKQQFQYMPSNQSSEIYLLPLRDVRRRFLVNHSCNDKLDMLSCFPQHLRNLFTAHASDIDLAYLENVVSTVQATILND